MRESSSIKQLVAALVEATKEFDKVTKNADNPFYKSRYSTLDHLIECTKSALLKHGIIITQDGMMPEVGQTTVTTKIAHVSGEWIETSVTLPNTKNGKSDAQTVGSAITYGRRYALSAALNIASEDDDDGTRLVGEEKAKGQSSGSRVDFSEIDEKLIGMTYEQSKDYYREIYPKLHGQRQKEIVQEKFEKHAKMLEFKKQ